MLLLPLRLLLFCVYSVGGLPQARRRGHEDRVRHEVAAQRHEGQEVRAVAAGPRGRQPRHRAGGDREGVAAVHLRLAAEADARRAEARAVLLGVAVEQRAGVAGETPPLAELSRREEAVAAGAQRCRRRGVQRRAGLLTNEIRTRLQLEPQIISFEKCSLVQIRLEAQID